MGFANADSVMLSKVGASPFGFAPTFDKPIYCGFFSESLLNAFAQHLDYTFTKQPRNLPAVSQMHLRTY